MLHKIPGFTHIVCLLLAWLCLGGVLCGAAEPPVADFTAGGGEGKWRISLSPDDSALTLTLNGAPPPDADPSTPAAARITVDLPTGWKTVAAELAATAPTPLTVTVSAEGARVVILVDGALQDLEGIAFRIPLVPVGNSCHGQITAACPEGIAYYDSTRGGVDSIPVAEARAVIGTGGGAGQETDTAAHEAATDEGSDGPTETAGPSGSGPHEPCASVRLIGCQETPRANGIFAVRFIYEIAGDGAGQGSLPAAGVVCLAGRGVISVEVTSADSVTTWVDGEATVTPAAEAYFFIVIFRGLSARDEWVFVAERGDGTRALARWQDGRFMGWTVG